MDAEDYLLEIPLWTKKKNTLPEVWKFLERMGNPDQRMKIIHVAGTNGKGSVCAYMTAELTRQGYRIGTFISPHLVSVRERLQLNGKPADIHAFEQTFEAVKPLIDTMVAEGYQHPSFFEYLFLMAMEYYTDHPVDFLILETGLGGLFDTTNVVDKPVLTVITSISLDHTTYLGTTISEIAAQKAGIIKPGCPVVYDDNCPEASAVIRARAAGLSAVAVPVRMPAEAEDFSAPYQAMNAALACRALQELILPGWRPEDAYSRLSKVIWPGRMEEVSDGIWLDGAHNEDGMRAFTAAAKRIRMRRGKRVHLLFAAVADKNYAGMIAQLCEKLPADRVTIAHLEDGRAAGVDELEAEFCKHLEERGEIRSFPTSRAALSYALKQKTGDDLLFVVGSLYLIGEIKAIMEERQ